MLYSYILDIKIDTKIEKTYLDISNNYSNIYQKIDLKIRHM